MSVIAIISALLRTVALGWATLGLWRNRDVRLAPVVGLAGRLRQAGMTVEMYPEQTRLGRQLAAAATLRIPYALIIGPDEIAQQRYTLKHLASGDQQTLDEAELLHQLRRV